MTPTTRLFLAAACFAAWLVLLFEGFALGGAVHLLAAAGIVLVPWRAPGSPAPTSPPEEKR